MSRRGHRLLRLNGFAPRRWGGKHGKHSGVVVEAQYQVHDDDDSSSSSSSNSNSNNNNNNNNNNNMASPLYRNSALGGASGSTASGTGCGTR